MDIVGRRPQWRRLSVLLANLPTRESATVRAVHGDAKVEWTPEVEYLAQLKTILSNANWQRGGGKGQRPRPDPRPGHGPIRIGGTTRPQAEVRALLDSYSYKPTDPDEEDPEDGRS